jgi:hypothetical protein
MDPQVPTSFIPKKSLDTGYVRGGVRTSGSFGLFFLLALLIFIASIAAAGAAFGYHQLLSQQLASKAKSLTLNEQAFDPAVIDQLSRVDDRITQAQKLLNAHLAPSSIFGFIGLHTLQSVRFTSLSYALNGDGTVLLSLSGNADSFATVALQSDEFATTKGLKNIVFSGIIPDDKGNITFAVSANLDPSLILYVKSLATGSDSTQAPTSSGTSTPTQ